MIIFDSSVWIAYLHENDSQHAHALKVFGQIDTDIILPEYIILEVSTILSQKVNSTCAHAFIERALNTQEIQILYSDESLFRAVVDLFMQRDWTGLSFVDICLVLLSQTYEVISFDKKLMKAIQSFKQK